MTTSRYKKVKPTIVAEKSVKMIKETTNEIFDKIILLMMSAFSLVAALAWNDAVQTLFKTYFGEQSGIIAKFLYAVVVTILVVVVTIWFGKMAHKKA